MTEQSITSHFRRRLVSTALAGLLVALAGAFAAPQSALSDDKNVVVFAGWGGNIESAQRKIFFDSFEKATGIKVIDVPGADIVKVKAMVGNGNVEWDVVQSLGMWVPLGEKENLWEKLDYAIIDRTGVPDTLVGPYGIGNSTYGMILAYNTKAFPAGKEPKSWADFWDVQHFPGKRGMLDEPRYNFETALMAAGAAPASAYPIDMEKAFASLSRVKKDIHVWWKQWPQVPILLSSQEIVMSLSSHTRILGVIKDEAAPLAIVWNHALMTVDSLAVPRGTPHREAAMKLVSWMTQAKLQAEFAKATRIGPANAEALKSLSESEREDLPSYHYQKGEMLLLDNAWWAANSEKAAELWNKWKLEN
ncbi:MAG TPA: polyamine ABC transporter substrate-binding protein [Alphaproteobacteria bacterium]|nr:polyamine ABC transporter substrate-binding protein [Alphaproteobacteria bacterium]